MPVVHPTLPADGDDAVVEPYNAAFALILGVLNGSIDSDNLADGAVTLAKLSSAISSSLAPSGVILGFGGSSAPTGFLMCDGSSYLRATYPTLFATIGVAYGSADGTHFNVPDLRGRVPVGADNLGGSAANRMQLTSTLTTTSGSPTATVGSATDLVEGMYVVSANVPAGTKVNNVSGTTVTLSANASGTGSAVAARFSNLTDAQTLGSTGGAQGISVNVDQMPSHTHLGGNMYNASSTFGGTGSTRNMLFIDTAGLQNVSIASTGGNQSHANVQPSVVTGYIIKT